MGSLQATRLLHTATLLSDNSVLVVGGHSLSAERFNPSSRAWTSAGASLRYRRNHTATRLMDGRVLVAGGADGKPDASTELYDPLANTWSLSGRMKASHRFHSATLLRDGSLLVAGGTETTTVPSAERYEPVSGTWNTTGPMRTPRRNHTATLLADGRVWVGGGEDTQGNRLASAEVFDPATGTWTSVAPMGLARVYHSATLLPDGSVLVVGGAPGTAATAERYNPGTNTWTVTPRMAHPRRYHTATALSDGSVLVAGGYDDSSGILTSVERYEPVSGSWCQAAPMAVPRYGHTATLLQEGQVLVAAGFGNVNQSSTEIHGPPLGCDAIPPRLTLASPSENFITRESRLTLAGSVDDAACTVTVNGTPLSLTGLGFTGTVPLHEGSNALRLVAEDTCHNRTTLVRNVLLDSTPPSLSFLRPEPGSIVDRPFIDVLLTHADTSSGIDPTSFQLLLDGKDVSGVLTHSASSASGILPLTQGPHTLEARIADRAGNLSQARVELQVQLPAVSVTLTQPTSGERFPAPASLLLAATARSSEGSITQVDFLSNGRLVHSDTSAPYSFTLAELAAGTYTLTARATDDHGTVSSSAPVTVTVVDPPNVPPTVVLKSPANGTNFSAPAVVRVVATATDPDGRVAKVEFLRDGVLAATVLTPPYEAALEDVPAGAHVLVARATDDRGSVTSSAPATISVTETSLTIFSPVSGASLVGNDVVVTGKSTGLPNSGVVVNGKVAASDASGRFSVLVPLVSGANTLTAVLTTPDGTTLTRSVIVLADGRASPFTITASPSVGLAPLAVSVTVTNPTPEDARFTFDGQGPFSLPAEAASRLSLSYPAGVAIPTVVITHHDGSTYTHRLVIESRDPSRMDQTFRALWSGLNEALVAGDKEGALRFLNGGARLKYGPVFDALMPHMSQIVGSYSALAKASISSDIGEYAVVRDDNGRKRLYMIYFLHDFDGTWRIDEM